MTLYNRTHPFAHRFAAAIPDEAVRHLLRGVLAAYQQGHRHCEEAFSKALAPQAFPRYRYDLIEDMLLASGAPRFASIRCERRHNQPRTAEHTCVVAPGATLTAHAVVSPRHLPRVTDFGVRYASMQLNLFEPNEDDGILCAALVHGPRDQFRPFPQFAGIGFPDHTFKKWEHFIDLTATIAGLRGVAPAAPPGAPALSLVKIKKPGEGA